MKSSKFKLQLCARFLAILIVFQSCNIYHSANISLEKAAETNRKVQVKTDSGDNLKFKWIDVDDGKFYGYTRENSGTSKKLQNLGIIGTSNGKFYSYGLETLKIDSVKAKNYTMSTIGTILISIVGIFAILGSLAAITWNSSFSTW